MSGLEVWGALTGLLCVWLLARQNIWTWPIGLANNVLFMVLFWRSRLYADSILQIVFAALGAYGWYQWLHPVVGAELPVRRTTPTEWVVLLAATIAGHAGAYWGLSRHTDSPVPFWDSAVLALSLAATYGQARKLLESWILWIVVDIISVPLYVSRGLHLTAGLYFLFLCLCVRGYMSWRADLAEPPPLPAPA